MRLESRSPARRGGFSLIEVLVVIAIIAILSSLILAGVSRVRIAAVRAQTIGDITQMSNAISAFKAKFNVSFIPSGGSGAGGKFAAKSSYSGSETEALYLKQVFPRMDLSNTKLTTQDLDSNQTLVLFLTGGPATGFTGFSTNPSAPFTAPPANTPQGIPAFMNMPASRLLPSGSSYPWYADFWNTPYAYFAFNGSSYNGVNSYTSGVPGVGATSMSNPIQDSLGRNEQPRGFQIISAGPDGLFGKDDLASFAQAGNVP